MGLTVAAPARADLRFGHRWRKKARSFGFALSVVVIVSPAILVFLWMLSLALKKEIDNLAYPPVFIPAPPTLNNFVQVFTENSMGLYFWNSIVVSGSATLVALAVCIPAGYGIARTQAHKLTVLILVYVMAGHFETLPKELEEAALIDGGSVWTSFRYVALPLARPGIVVATILAFIFSWNNFVFGAVLASRATRTLPAAVYNVLTFEQLAWGPLAAAALVVTVPVLLLTIVIQKEIVVGLTHGGVKA